MSNHELPLNHEQERQRSEARIRDYILRAVLHVAPGTYDNGDDTIESKNQ